MASTRHVIHKLPPPLQVPKSGDGQPSLEGPPESKKQVSYKTEIIGGVPIITPTQVRVQDPTGPYLADDNAC